MPTSNSRLELTDAARRRSRKDASTCRSHETDVRQRRADGEGCQVFGAAELNRGHAKGDRREALGCSHTSRWCECRETLQPAYATPSTDWRRDGNGCAPFTSALTRASIAQITSLSGALVPKPYRAPSPGFARKSQTANHAVVCHPSSHSRSFREVTA